MKHYLHPGDMVFVPGSAMEVLENSQAEGLVLQEEVESEALHHG